MSEENANSESLAQGGTDESWTQDACHRRQLPMYVRYQREIRMAKQLILSMVLLIVCATSLYTVKVNGMCSQAVNVQRLCAPCPSLLDAEQRNETLLAKFTLLSQCKPMLMVEPFLTQFCYDKRDTSRYKIYSFYADGFLRIDAL